MRKYIIKQFTQEYLANYLLLFMITFIRLNKPGEGFKTLENMINQKFYLIWVVLSQDTRSNDSRSNDARFMRKLSKRASIMRRKSYNCKD